MGRDGGCGLVSARTDAWREDIAGDSFDGLIDAAWEMVETIEHLEGKYVVREGDAEAATKLLNMPGDTLGDCRDLLRTMIGHAEKVSA